MVEIVNPSSTAYSDASKYTRYNFLLVTRNTKNKANGRIAGKRKPVISATDKSTGETAPNTYTRYIQSIPVFTRINVHIIATLCSHSRGKEKI